MKTIFDAGLRLFVIYQDARQYYIENPSEENIYHYFDAEQGYADAEKALSVAKSLGVPRNEIIYFAVDYDFMAGDVESKIKPYFEAINRYAREAGNPIRIGIYGARNTCTIIRRVLREQLCKRYVYRLQRKPGLSPAGGLGLRPNQGDG